ncbi:uncharacterized protein [Montipora capricornis]|uniref:uncharacterized protein n=1 Tax=Montipora capricornis TaxID=246305 RepID=UPI0035F1B926
MADCEIEGTYILENVETGRYLFADGNKVKDEERGEEVESDSADSSDSGDSTGLVESPQVKGADANYYNRAIWKIIPQGDGKYFLQNPKTQRFLMQDGEKMSGERGAEKGWKQSSGFEAPPAVASDMNYFNRAYWMINHQGCGNYFLENVETQRYLFQDGEKIQGNRGDEKGWKASSGFEAPGVVGADANYYNRAYWKLLKQ